MPTVSFTRPAVKPVNKIATAVIILATTGVKFPQLG
ncbi:hypothetical protein Tco_0681420, partial [Tanacetum coccineum]